MKVITLYLNILPSQTKYEKSMILCAANGTYHGKVRDVVCSSFLTHANEWESNVTEISKGGGAKNTKCHRF